MVARTKRLTVGNSTLACAFGQKACRDDHVAFCKSLPRMFAELESGRGLQIPPPVPRQTRSNQLPVAKWHDLILDRVIHTAHSIELTVPPSERSKLTELDPQQLIKTKENDLN